MRFGLGPRSPGGKAGLSNPAVGRASNSQAQHPERRVTNEAVTKRADECRPGHIGARHQPSIGAATQQQIGAEVTAMNRVVSTDEKNRVVNSVTKSAASGDWPVGDAVTASHDSAVRINRTRHAANNASTACPVDLGFGFGRWW